MRCGFAPLAERVKTVIGQDPLGGHLFSVELRASGVAMVLDRIDVSLLKRVPRCAGVAPLDEREALRTQIAHRDDLGSFGFRDITDQVGSPIPVPDHSEADHRRILPASALRERPPPRAAPLMRAGTPATTAYGGTSLVTTAPAPTSAPSPMVTPHRMVALLPMEARAFTSVSSHFQSASVQIWNVPGDDGSRAHQRALADGHAAQDGGVAPDGSARFHQRFLALPVGVRSQGAVLIYGSGIGIVNEHGAVADENAALDGNTGANERVARYLAVLSDDGAALDLDERGDLRAVAYDAAV